MPRRLLALLASLLALPLVLWGAPAHAAAPSYVALGDSYSSGVGTRSYISDGTSCERSTYAYPSRVAASRGYALSFQACSGAKVSDVSSKQLGVLSTSTSFVTLSVGGNDAGFTGTLTECAKPAWLSNCGAAVSKANSYITHTLPGTLATLYAAIRNKAPNAQVVIVGYPHLFNGEDCNASPVQPERESSLNATADRLNGVLATAATAKGFRSPTPPAPSSDMPSVAWG
jgi:lysophospholipase L1-like esterase